MKKFLTHTSLSLLLVFVCLWSAPAHSTARQWTQRQATLEQLQPEQAQPEQSQVAASKSQLAGEIWNRTELYFGSAKPDGSVVTEADYQLFVNNEVTPRFPDGLTVLTGYGQFRNSAGIIVKERSMVLILFYPLNMKGANRKIEEIREAYKRAFQQESVLRADSLSVISF